VLQYEDIEYIALVGQVLYLNNNHHPEAEQYKIHLLPKLRMRGSHKIPAYHPVSRHAMLHNLACQSKG
jgi:hypothetical protein